MAFYTESSAMLRKAVAADTAGDVVEAISLYESGIAMMQKVVQQETDPGRVSMVNAKIMQYVERVQQLQPNSAASLTAVVAARQPSASAEGSYGACPSAELVLSQSYGTYCGPSEKNQPFSMHA